MAWGDWSDWASTSGRSPFNEGNNNNGWNHCEMRYRTDTYMGGAKVQWQIRSMRDCNSKCFSGDYQYYSSTWWTEWSGAGSLSGDTGGLIDYNCYGPCPGYNCNGDRGDWHYTGDYTCTISNAAGGSGVFSAYTRNGWGMLDYDLSISLSFPASTATFSTSGSNVKFDVYVDGVKVASQVSSYSASHTIGSSYIISNITANSGYRLAASTASSYSGTISESGASVSIPAAVKIYSFSWTCSNCTGDPYLGTTLKANDSNSYSMTFDTGSSLAVKDIKVKSGYFFADSNTTTKSDLSATNRTSDLSWSYSATACVAPSGGSAILVSRIWNGIVARATLASYGTPSSISGRLLQIGVLPASATSYSSKYTYAENTDALGTGNKAFTHANLVGCASFKLGWYADNKGACSKSTTNSGVNSTVYYLPPAPMVSASATTTSNETDITVTFKAKGAAADGTNNILGAKVNYQYCYSTDGGATYTNWITFATDTAPSVEQTASFHADYNLPITIQVRQANFNDTSQVTAVKTISLSPVHPKPKAPIIQNLTWDELRRTLRVQVQYNGNYGQSGAATFDHFDLEMTYNSDWSNPFKTLVGTTETWDVDTSYMRPNRPLYIRATCTNNWGEVSVWDTKAITVKRPIWGRAERNTVRTNIIDIIQVNKSGNFSQRDWIEGDNLGKNRIVKKV